MFNIRKKKPETVSRDKYEDIKKIYLESKKSYLELEAKYKHELYTNSQLKNEISRKNVELEYLNHKINELYEKYKDLSKNYEKLENRIKFLLSELENRNEKDSEK
uniref:DNA repair exonuclease SbcCD ATPase subunit n=1 Tax=Methanococcus maripaludis (strain C6 / ATCC BAA-1332) TaxID=444158 RepID=A9AAK0_METM6